VHNNLEQLKSKNKPSQNEGMGRNVTTWEEANTLKRYAGSSAERATNCRELREGQTVRSPIVETRRACLARKKHLLGDFVERKNLVASGRPSLLDPTTAVANAKALHSRIEGYRCPA
jgi:hypothetical protein